MLRSTLLPFLLLSAVCAQQPSLEVQDLLGTNASQSRASTSSLVRRTEMRSRPPSQHIVSGEGHLFAQPRPFFDERSLEAVLAQLPTARQLDLEIVHIGERVQLRSASPEQLAIAVDNLRRGLPPRLQCSIKIERVVGERRVALLSGAEAFTNGETAIISDVQHEPLVSDIEVEIAQAAASANPVTHTVTYGASALLRVRQLPGSDIAIVELVARLAAPFEAPPIPTSGVVGAFDRVATSFGEAGMVFRAVRGKPSEHEWTANDGSRLRVICTVDWTDAPAGAPSNVLCTPLLNSPVIGFRSVISQPSDEPTESVPLATYAESILAAGDDGSQASASLLRKESVSALLWMRDEAGRREVARLLEGVADMLQPTSVTLEAFDVPAGTPIDASKAVPAGVNTLLSISGPGIVGLPSCFASGRERSIVHDWDCEVAQAARISDPKVRMCEDGWFATVKMLPSVGRQPRRIELSLDLQRFVELRQLDLPVSTTVLASTESQSTVLPAEVVPVEQAVTRVVVIGTTLLLDQAGNAVLRRAAPQLLGEGRELVVRVAVR